MIHGNVPQIGPEEIAAVEKVLKSGQITQGPEVEMFEQEFGEMVVDNAHCVAVNSGTSALHLGLLAMGIGPGDEVIVPAFSFAATGNAVSMTGAVPTFADIRFDSLNVDPESVEALIGPKTAAIIPVHIFGNPSDMDAIRRIAERHRLGILEDAAQAHDARYHGNKVGVLGDAAAFSFYATKNMTCGEGGMFVSRDKDLVDKVRHLRNQGQLNRYQYVSVGLNNRMSDLHAAVGRVQLQKLSKWTQRRQEIASAYGCLSQLVATQKVSPKCESAYHQFSIVMPAELRDQVLDGLREQGIAASVYYPQGLHEIAPLKFGLEATCPTVERVTRGIICLPISPQMTDEEVSFTRQVVSELL